MFRDNWVLNASVANKFGSTSTGTGLSTLTVTEQLVNQLGLQTIYPTSHPMNKDCYVVINATGGLVSINKTLDDAKESARSYSNNGKIRCFICQPVWACAPKNDLEETDL